MMDIRPVGLDESAILLDIIVRAFEQYRDQRDPLSGVFKETVEDIRHKLEKGGGFFALLENTPVGAVLYEPRPDYIYLGRLAVPPEYRGRGIAHHLVAAVEAEACQRGFSTVRLGVRITLEENRAMFLHLGFQEISAEKHPGYSSPTFLVMEKAVDC